MNDGPGGAVVGALGRPHTIGVLDWAAAASAAHIADVAGDAICHEPSPWNTMAGGVAREETEGWSIGRVASWASSVGCGAGVAAGSPWAATWESETRVEAGKPGTEAGKPETEDNENCTPAALPPRGGAPSVLPPVSRAFFSSCAAVAPAAPGERGGRAEVLA